MKFTYAAPGGSTYYQVNYKPYTVATNFGVSGIHEYTSYPATVPLVNNIVLPDGSEYTFQYESTPSTPASGACTPVSGTTCVTARVTKITLPTGGAITYAYSGGNNGIFSDGSTATLTRTTPDGQWIYAQQKYTYPETITTITGPGSNQTLMSFDYFYEIGRQVYQGSTTSGQQLEAVTTAYNGGGTFTPPITAKAATTQIGTSGPKATQSTQYNTYGLLTSEADYDYPSGTALLRSIWISYAALGNGIVSLPASIALCTGSSNCTSTGSQVQQTTYTYDQGTLSTSSGTPQHVSVTGSRGNLTTVTSYVSGSRSVNQTYTYWDTGMVNTATDVNTGVTTYTYGTGSCGNAFPTNMTEAINTLTQSYTWNCVGGVQVSVTDENGKIATTTYNDPYFWRPNAMTDQNSNTTNLGYSMSGGNEVGMAMWINFGSSTANTGYGYDSQGRTIAVTHAQSPSGGAWDQVIYSFDSNGRPYTATAPCSSSTSWSCPYIATTRSYDPLNRVTEGSDGGGGYTTYNYSTSANDVLVTTGPNPGTENLKKRQLEYDGLGRLTSVCEITSSGGSGTCGQKTTQIGFWTKYTYDAAGHILTVTQNAQATSGQQSRSYTYDGLGRLASETNPESNTTTYTYDAFPSSCYNFGDPQTGNLTGVTDANGNTSCLHYDRLHRLLDLGSSGPNASYCKRYRYDAPGNGVTGSAPSGITVSYVGGRLMEAETDNCGAWPPTPITDEWFSYDPVGETVGFWQLTPHSPGYYQSTATYWPNGVLESLSGPEGYGMTWNLDGEGRVASTSNTSGLSGTTYNAGSQVTQLTYGSGDSDSFVYDSNTSRMKKYVFSVNGQSVTGTVNWNAMGTLGSLVISDAIYSANSQTCNYTHDDLIRLIAANCGSAWSQTFGYDTFGNITQAGRMTFSASYATSETNRLTYVGSTPVTYDGGNSGAGNVLSDGLHTYTWDAYGLPTSIGNPGLSTVSLTYDALGRMVEQNNNGSFTQIAYSPSGFKVSILNGATPIREFVPLPGGAMALWTGGTVLYEHPDWQGSARLVSALNRTVFSDANYAPFGATYTQSGATYASFTGMEHDTVPNLYDFPAREYEISGRWPSPDPAGLAAVDPSNPQSWNRYAYVLNNPLGLTDPSGLYCNDIEGNETGDDASTCIADGGTWTSVCGVDTLCGTGPNAPPPPPPLIPVIGIGVGPSFTFSAGFFSGWTFGVSAPNQTYKQCLNANSSNYSLNTFAGTDNFLLNNDVGQLLFGNSAEGSRGLLFFRGVSSTFEAGVGTVMTAGRRTASITSMNLAGTTGPAPRILAKTGAGELAGWLSGVAELKMAADVGLAGAEAFGCLVPR
jgi:RHS repeat-associated protein